MKRITIWTVSLAVIGGLLGAKGAWIEWRNVLTGAGGGAVLGFLIGFLLQKAQGKRHPDTGVG
jgi:hypothetical protein